MIFDIKRFAIHDGPGARTTVFLKGCTLRCRWCHNPESQALFPQLSVSSERCIACSSCIPLCSAGALSLNTTLVVDRILCDHCGACVIGCPTDTLQIIGRRISLSDLIDELARDQILYDESGGGVTFSGGEPLMQGEFLVESLRACRQRGWHTAVDTSGYGHPDVIKRVAEWTDLFLYDLKLLDESEHQRYISVENENILHNLILLDSWGADIVIRIPMIPGYTATRSNIHSLLNFVRTKTNVREIHLLNYHSHGRTKFRRLGLVEIPLPVVPLSNTEMKEYADLLRTDGFEVKIGG